MIRAALAAFLAVVAVSWVAPPFQAEQALHHSLTAVALAALLLVHRRRPLPAGSFLTVLASLTLHTVAARWIYSFVPYDDWADALTGYRPVDVFGWRPGWAAVAAVDAVLSSSALYELFEWGIAMTLAPGAAEAYNGQQGDAWDAHRDMALATGGAVLVVLALGLRRGHNSRRSPEPVKGIAP